MMTSEALHPDGARRAALLAALLLCTGCGYLGSARRFDPASLEREPGWVAARAVPLVLQKGKDDCGAAAVAMVLNYWRVPATADQVQIECLPSGSGLRAGDLRDFVRGRGLEAFLIRGERTDLENELSRGRPVIVGLVKPYIDGGRTHYEVVVALHPAHGKVVTLDPTLGWQVNTWEGLHAEWEPAGQPALIVFPSADEGLE